jgi:hypothetical protein
VAAEPDPALALLRECQDRVLEREGIPMVLCLVSETGPMPDVRDEVARADGERLAAAMDGYRASLVPRSRDADMGCLISVLQVTSYADYGRAGGRL